MYDKSSYMLASRRHLPSIASLSALEAVDRLGSASAAADELSLTQSAISRQLQALERQLGVSLVMRHGRSLGLTPAAQAYATDIREALTKIAQASLKLRVAPVGGSLNLGILPTFGMRWLMPRLPDFARRHPDITINMTTRMTRFDFARDTCDAALHFGTADWPDTGHLLLKREYLVAVAAPDVLVSAPIAQPRDLLRQPLLHIQTRPDAWQDWLSAQGVAVTRPLPGTMYDQFATIVQAALHGLGFALLPDYLIERDLATGRLVAACGGKQEARGAYYLVWPKARAGDPALSAFRDWMADQAEPEDPLPR